MKVFALVVAVVIHCCTVSTCLADPLPESDEIIEVQSRSGETLTRLLLTIDNKTLSQLWNAYFERLFEFLDRDGDGRLDATEAARIPSAAWLKAQWRGDFDNVPTPFVVWRNVDQSPKDEHISTTEFATFYRNSGLGHVDVQPGRTVAALNERSARRLFEELAGNADTKWTQEGLINAAERLRRYDSNDDQRWSVVELNDLDATKADQKKSNASQSAPSFHLSTQRKGPLLNINLSSGGDSPGEIRAAQRITPTEIDWMQNATGKRADSMTLVETGMLARIRVSHGLSKEAYRSAVQAVLQQFEIDDLDRNQAIDAAEAKRSPMSESFQALLTLADRNTDGKLTIAEMQAYLDLQSIAVGQHVIWGVADHGVPLFELIDANDDGSLTLRELGNAWQRTRLVSAKMGSDRLSWNDLPRKSEWTFSIGAPRTTQVQRPPQEAEQPATHAWFSKMDRNRDGDLSRREFLGEAREFQRLDKDADGLISPQEAVQGFLK